MDKKILTPDEQLRREKAKRHKMQMKIKELKKRSDILTAVSVFLSIVIAIAVIFVLTRNMNSITEDKGSRLSKDNAITAMLSLPIISVNVDGNDVQIKNMTDMFSILSPGTWEATTEKPKGTETVVFTIESGYTIALYDTKYVLISDGASSRTYKTPSVISSEIATFISDNTTITAEDLSSLIGQTKEVFYNSPYYSDYIAAGTGLSAALDTPGWTEIDFYPATENPTTTITAWDNVTISLYDASNVGVVIFNGNATYYKFPSEVITDIKAYISKSISAESAIIKDKLTSYHELTLMTPTNQYSVIPDGAFADMLGFDQWRRNLDTPSLPASPAYDITDGKEFSLRFFKNEYTVEVNGGEQYYTVPADVLLNIEIYIQKASTPTLPADPEIVPPQEEQDVVMLSLIQKITEGESLQSKLSVKFADFSATLDITEDFRLLLNLQLWQKADSPTALNTETARSLAFRFADQSNFVIYPEYGVVAVSVINTETAFYTYPLSMDTQIEAYTKTNAVAEAVTITHDQLITLISAQTNIHAASYQGVSSTFTNGDSVSVADVVKWIASLSIKDLAKKPSVSNDKKLVLTFEGEQNVTLTFAAIEDGTCVLNVLSKNTVDGAVTDVWFTVLNKPYQTVSDEVSVYMTAMVNAVALNFAQAVKDGDMDTISQLLKVDDMEKWGYDKFFSATVSDATVLATETAGTYNLAITVSKEKESSLAEGKNEFTMTVAYNQNDGELYVHSLKHSDYVDTSALENEEVTDLITFISRCTNLPFVTVTDIDTDALINYCMFLTRKYGDSTKTEFSQMEINSAAMRYFEITNLSDATSTYFDIEKGMYVFSGTAAVTPSITVIKDESEDDIFRITIAHTKDPLGLFFSEPITYTMKRVSVTENIVIDGEDGVPVTEQREYHYYIYVSAIPTQNP